MTVGGALGRARCPVVGSTPHVAVNGPLGAQFLAWETATAVAGRVLGINPFDQPNVTESKENTNRILSDGLPRRRPRSPKVPIEVYGDRRSPRCPARCSRRCSPRSASTATWR